MTTTNETITRRGISHMYLMGNIGNDPTSKVLPSGTLMTRIRVAHNRNWNDSDGNRQEAVSWFSVVGFGRTAEIMKEYCYKGQYVMCEGEPRTQQYKDKTGANRESFELNLSTPGGKITFLTMRPNTAVPGTQSSGEEDHSPVTDDPQGEPF